MLCGHIFQNTLDFYRTIRNTVHNNGIYFHKNRKTENINWNGKTYTFNYGKKINFATWDLLFEVLTDILNKMKKLFTNKQLSIISEEMSDPFAQ
jgi:hypothetical protein